VHKSAKLVLLVATEVDPVRLVCHACAPWPCRPNAGLHLLPEAGAQRTL
jgi:hypothetical protein